MTQLTEYKPKVLPPPTKEDSVEAEATHQKILSTIGEVRKSESNLERGYVELGKLINKMSVNTYWMVLGYSSWRDYFDFLQEKFGKGRTQLYGYVGTVKALAPYVDDKTLSDMGISKASELKKDVNLTGKAPSQELIDKAVDPKITIPNFRQAVLEEFHITDHNEAGTWYDLKGVYFTPDEKEEWERAVKLAKEVDPPVPHTLPGHVQFKEVLLRLAAEFITEHDWKAQQDPSGFVSSYTPSPEEAAILIGHEDYDNKQSVIYKDDE